MKPDEDKKMNMKVLPWRPSEHGAHLLRLGFRFEYESSQSLLFFKRFRLEKESFLESVEKKHNKAHSLIKHNEICFRKENLN